ncbi:hypothetical protein [Pendulispora albinea]|uniref:Glycosyltransferase RgtA/B/C/D-like domain-containing protein n=1 Tax=Pendulispora albinea TaxID=2741071 RepID=A0ABZ2LXY8_9BACT
MPRLSPRIFAAASVALALVYGVVLAVFKWVPRYDCIVFTGVLVLVFRWLDGNRARPLALHLVTQVLVVSLVAHLWTLGYEGRNAIFGGVLPWSDSYTFYDDAVRFLFGERFDGSSKRPLFTSVFAVLLRISNGDLRFALLACAMAGGWAISMATLAVWKTHGARSAFVVYLILFFFERRWAGSIQTEHLGLPLGLIGFVLVWRADDAENPQRRQWLVLAGIFSIALGLMARAGAFFVLPAIALWAVRDAGRKRRLRMLSWSAAAMLAAFGVHKAVLHFTGSGVTFSDYPPIAYGLLHDDDYTRIHKDHPELDVLPVDARVRATWKVILHDVAQQPSLVPISLVRSGAAFFTSPFGMFSYVWTNPDDAALEDGAAVREAMARDGVLGPLYLWTRTFGLYSLLNAGAMGAIGAGFVLGAIGSLYIVFVRERSNGELSLLRHVMAGVLLSAPFTPPWITSNQQVQTATLAFVAALPAVALVQLRARQRGSGPPSSVTPYEARRLTLDSLAYAAIGFSAALVAAVVWIRLAPLARPRCGSPEDHVVMPYWDAAVEVKEERTNSFRNKGIQDLRFSIRYLQKHNPELTDSIEPFLRAGTRYVAGFDACDAHVKILVDDAHALGVDPSWRTLDARPQASPKILRVLGETREPGAP